MPSVSCLRGNKDVRCLHQQRPIALWRFLRRAINKFFDVKEKLKDMRKEMLKDMKKELPEDVKADELRARTRAITDPAKEFKLAMVHRGGIEALAKKDRTFTRAFSKFKNVLNAYDKRYEFGKNGLYYDCKENR
ncbi:hypothetical protein BDF22DRAFT_636010 [Syncephalis plumigaleata]|nr:hypothetical protein BDF22DRAFT_636010 [Syncephalis plumigaleata]